MGKTDKPEPGSKIYDNPFGRWSKEVDKYTEAHLVGIMASLIAIFSAAIGTKVRIRTRGRGQPLGVWVILCGISGFGRKGTATNLALEIAEEAIPDFMERHLQVGFDSGLGIVAEYNDRQEQGVSDDPAGNSLLIVEEELSKLQEAGKKDRRLGATLTKIWDGKSLRYKTGKDDFEVRHPHAGFIGHVQPKLFQSTKGSKDAAGGTWNRFLILHVQKSKNVRVFGELKGYDETIAKIAQKFQKAVHYARDQRFLHVPPQVADVFESRHRLAIEEMVGESEQMAEFAERSLGYILRVAAVYALADQRNTITVADFDSALDLLLYSGASIRYVLGGAKGAGKSTLAERVFNWAKTHAPDTFTALRNAIGNRTPAEAVYKAIAEWPESLVLYELPRQNGKLGRPAKYVAMTGDGRIPPEAIFLDPRDFFSEDKEEEPTVEDHPNYRVQEEPTVKAERVDTPKEAPQEPEKPQEPVKALPAPKPAKTGPKPSGATTEPPKPKEGGTKVKKPIRKRPASAWL